MERDPLLTLLGLGVVLVFAVGTVVLLLRVSGRAVTQRGGFVQGYPPSQYPAQALTGGRPAGRAGGDTSAAAVALRACAAP